MNEERKNDVLIVQQSMQLTDGLHEGKIKTIIASTTSMYDYLDVLITTKDDNGKEIELKAGFPAYISMSSSFGKFLTRAGMDFKPSDKLSLNDIVELLKGKPVTFQTTTENTERGEFKRIINGTIQFK